MTSLETGFVMGQPGSREEVVRHSIELEYQQFARSRKVNVQGAFAEDDLRQLQGLCARPEFGPFLSGTSFRFDASLPYPFIARDGCTVLGPTLLEEPVVAAVLLRQALELCMLQRLLPGQQDPVTRLVVAALSHHTAAAYWSGLIRVEKNQARSGLADWFLELADQGLGDASALLHCLRHHGEAMLPLQGDDRTVLAELGTVSSVESMVQALLAETIALAYPTEWLLTQGGDNRLLIDSETGLNKYGCSPRPRSWAVTFASCTGSSISDLGYAAAETLRQELLLNAFRHGLADATIDEADRLRRAIFGELSLDIIPGTEIMLTSSGTDSELIALYFTLGGHDERVTNIVMAPDEVGSGTVPAASGCHFDTLTPMGTQVEPGTPVLGVAAERVELVKVPVRRESGDLIGVEKLDRQVSDVVQRACARGDRVLLHLLDSSKTGVGAPSITTARAIKARYGAQVQVLVDAAQMRVSRQALQSYVKDGFMVLITGSKFFTGPPFSGALVVPAATAHCVDQLPPFPDGFADYTNRSDFPSRWRALASKLPERPNIGLLLRWRAALWEMSAFFAVPTSEQFDSVRRFLSCIMAEIQENAYLKFVTAPAMDRLNGAPEAKWDQIQTIYSFFVKRGDGASHVPMLLTYEEARQAYRWLNMDISSFLPSKATAEEKRVAGVRCHIGQPVRIFREAGVWYAALRIAVGARLISGIEFDLVMGGTREERFRTELEGALTILKKLTLIGRYWGVLQAANIEKRYLETIDGFRF